MNFIAGMRFLGKCTPVGVACPGVDVGDVGAGGEVADVDPGAGVADGLDKEQLTGEVDDGHCVDSFGLSFGQKTVKEGGQSK